MSPELPLKNDEPVLDDHLERMALVEQIADAVATCQPPQVFGIHGDWGLGKTSLLHQVSYVLTGDCGPQSKRLDEQKKDKVNKAIQGIPQHIVGKHKDRVKVVWFEAWRYQSESVPVVALLHEIRAQLAWYAQFLRKTKKYSEVTIRSLLGFLDSLTVQIKAVGIKIRNPFEVIQQTGEKWEKEHLADSLPCDHVRRMLQEALDQLLICLLSGKEGRRVVVLIDDLDRCESEAAYRLLEGLKMFLRLDNCVFVLGMNQQIIEDAIGKHVPSSGDGEEDKIKQAARASSYLEKLCQTIWHVPAVRKPKEYLLSLLPRDDDDPNPLKRWLELVIGDLNCLPPNPRRIKGVANTILRKRQDLFRTLGRKKITREEISVRETRRMLIVALIYQLHPELFRLWELHPDLYPRFALWALRGGPPTTIEGQVKPPKDHIDKMLDRLHRVVVYDPSAGSVAGAGTSSKSTYPDPADPWAFWVQPLIIREELAEGRRDSQSDEIIPQNGSVFLPYLRGF